MKYRHLLNLQKKRIAKNKPHVDIKIEHCKYCGESLVRLRTVARCFQVIALEDNHVIWIDSTGAKRRDGILTKDHFIPKSKGGNNHSNNIVPSCGPCNSRKSDSFVTVNNTGEIIF